MTFRSRTVSAGIRPLLFLTLLLAAAGCAEEADHTGHAQTLLDFVRSCAECNHGDSIELVGEGAYEVPLADNARPALVHAATTFVDEVELEVSSTSVELKYDLPQALVGLDDEKVELSASLEQEGPLVLTGDAGEASCVVTVLPSAPDEQLAIDLECDELLSGVQIDIDGVAAHLAKRGLPAAAINAHVEVSTGFRDDPIGILTGRLRFDD